MRKQTDLAKVKQTARSLLFTDIHETEFSPVIVSHPFTDSGFVASPNANGEIGLLNITESDADQRRWREYMGKLIDGAKSAYEIYMMITKPYGLTFLKYTAQDLSQEDLSNILASAWTRAEAPNMDVNVSKAKLLSLFKQADPTVLMEQDEYVQFKMLDDPVTVYRGVTTHNAKNVKALSWTLSRETAEWFANRFGEKGTVYEAQIDKKHIYAYAYLLNKRGIDREVLNAFFNAGLIYESADYHNAVFVGRNQEGVAVHAHKRGTGSESTFKGNVDSSDPRYSFHWTGRSNRVYLFEAPIDMLSFISLNKDGWRNHSYAAACGVSDQVMWQMLADHPQVDTVYLCHDSDVDGQKAAVRIANKLTEQGINTEILVPIRKDWNEDLLYLPDETEEEICTQIM